MGLGVRLCVQFAAGQGIGTGDSVNATRATDGIVGLGSRVGDGREERGMPREDEVLIPPHPWSSSGQSSEVLTANLSEKQ